MPVGTTDALTALHDHYIRAVNTAIAAGREPLAEELAQQYADDALALILPGDGIQPASA
ncbi:MAG: hypothetical protein H0T66_10140 [Geodermatophilaceae bacterium]|nr:hypothetical protein [Geodermatophilaceae bacterium]MDQ3454642.1 hypothetical protein [Actinomycetota bacterium]